MKLSGWGRYPVIGAEARSFETGAQAHESCRALGDCIVHAMGASYGDSALSERVLLTRRYNKIRHFDPRTGVVTCESGVSLGELVEAFVPRGWFLAVTPGTKYVSVGGAIASDVHGKNHHKAGCFSAGVLNFDLLLPSGEIVACSPENNRAMFLATCGGMGLTGVILTASLQLRPIRSSYIRQTAIRCGHFDEIFHLFQEYNDFTYSVAWMDCLASGENLGRGILLLGEHADSGPLEQVRPRQLTMPLVLPSFCLNRYAISLFNHLYYNRAPDFTADRLVPLEEFFYPLDKIRHWNRMYGRRGFTQYQIVLPQETSRAGLKKVLAAIAGAGLGSFLGVLKLFGPQNDNLLSFPRAGCTLALDFKINRELFPFLEKLDQMVLDHGGRHYLAKDVRLSRDTFRQGYPEWERFAALREQGGSGKTLNSRQSRRLGI